MSRASLCLVEALPGLGNQCPRLGQHTQPGRALPTGSIGLGEERQIPRQAYCHATGAILRDALLHLAQPRRLLVVLHQRPTLEDHTLSQAELHALCQSARYHCMGEFAHGTCLTTELGENGPQVLSPYEVMGMRQMLGHRQPRMDAGTRLLRIPQIPQDMTTVKQAGQCGMRDIREALVQCRVTVRQRLLQVVTCCGERAERQQREAHRHVGFQEEGRVLVRLGQGEEALCQRLGRLALAARLIKVPQPPERCGELWGLAHLLAEGIGAHVDALDLRGRYPVRDHQHRTECHLQVELSLCPCRALRHSPQQGQTLPEMALQNCSCDRASFGGSASTRSSLFTFGTGSLPGKWPIKRMILPQ